MDNSLNTQHLTEPILDASYLDDELGLMLTNDLERTSGETFGFNRHHLTLTTSNNNNSNQEELVNLSSISGSILDQLDLVEELFSSGGGSVATTTPTTSSISIPLHPTPNSMNPTYSTYSTDSLDINQSLFSCKKPNYTIAFDKGCGEDFKSPSDNNNGERCRLPDLGFLKEKKLTRPEKKVLVKPNKGVRNDVVDWASLAVLLPTNYESLLETKPSHLREKGLEEKEKDDGEKVVLRKKRQSLGYEKKEREKFKRFSLQEIEEVGMVCRGIERVLRVLEEPVGGKEEVKDIKEKEGKIKDKANRRKSGRSVSVDNRDPLPSLLSALSSIRSPLPRSVVYSNSTHAKTLQNVVFPALYSFFSDGLVGWIETLFGRVQNSVWKFVEGSVGGAPTTQILSELVLRINSESELMGEEGPLKFNAFIAGLLNLGALPSYLSLLRTKDRLLRTHYSPGTFFFSINTTMKSNYDSLITQCKVFNRIRYDLDIFYETKLLHCRLGGVVGKMKRSFSDERPLTGRKEGKEIPKSRTSGNIKEKINGGGKIGNGGSGGKFKKLQLQWEIMSGSHQGEVTSPVGGVSRIPRLIGSKRPGSAVVSPVGSGCGWRK